MHSTDLSSEHSLHSHQHCNRGSDSSTQISQTQSHHSVRLWNILRVKYFIWAWNIFEMLNILVLLPLVSLWAQVSGAPQFGFLSDFLSLFSFGGSDVDARVPDGPGGCGAPGNKPNHVFAGRDYLISWRIGCSSFSQSSADAFCRRNGMRWGQVWVWTKVLITNIQSSISASCDQISWIQVCKLISNLQTHQYWQRDQAARVPQTRVPRESEVLLDRRQDVTRWGITWLDFNN